MAEWFHVNSLGSVVTEESALGVTGYWRAINIVAGTIAGLPLKTYRELPSGERVRVKSFLDNPAAPARLTPYAWKELVLVHLLTRGEAFLIHNYNNAGGIIGTSPAHPGAVQVKWGTPDWDRDGPSRKVFTVQYANGKTADFDEGGLTHIMGLTLDGWRGLAPLTLFRRTIQLGQNLETAAQHVASSGLLISGLITPDSDITEDEAKAIKAGLDSKLTGPERAGGFALVNRNLKLQPLSLTPENAQFIQSREFQVVEFARMIGVPPHLLGATEKQTSWGTGIAEQNAGLAKFTLKGWTSRVEEALSALLPANRFGEFDYAGLLQGTPQQEIELLIKQVQAGLLTADEARAIRNLAPLTPEQRANTADPRYESAGALIRAGFEPADALTSLGLPPIKHLGLPPVTVQSAKEPAQPPPETPNNRKRQ